MFEYIRVVKDEWLVGKTLDIFKEQKTMSDLNYKIYTVPDQTEHTVALSEAMLLTSDPRHILQDVYSSPIIPSID